MVSCSSKSHVRHVTWSSLDFSSANTARLHLLNCEDFEVYDHGSPDCSMAYVRSAMKVAIVLLTRTGRDARFGEPFNTESLVVTTVEDIPNRKHEGQACRAQCKQDLQSGLVAYVTIILFSRIRASPYTRLGFLVLRYVESNSRITLHLQFTAGRKHFHEYDFLLPLAYAVDCNLANLLCGS